MIKTMTHATILILSACALWTSILPIAWAEPQDSSLRQTEVQSGSTATKDQPSNKPITWAFALLGGWVDNVFRINYTVDLESLGEIEGEKEFHDGQWVLGGTFVMTTPNFTFQNTFYFINQINQSDLLGDRISFEKLFWVAPRLKIDVALGGTYYYIKSFFKTFDDTFSKLGIDAKGVYNDLHAIHHMMYLDPRLGLRVDLPIQHWYIAPFMGSSYELTKRIIQSKGGHATYTGSSFVDLPETLPELNSKDWDDFYITFLGLDVFLDYRSFLQLQTRFYYYTVYHNFDLQVTGNLFFHPHFGITTYFEYYKGITNDNIIIFAGPILVF